MGILCREFDPVTKCGSEFGKIFPSIIVCYFVSLHFFFNGPGTKFIMYNHTFRAKQRFALSADGIHDGSAVFPHLEGCAAPADNCFL